MKKLLAMVLALALCLAACGACADEINWDEYCAEHPDVVAQGRICDEDDVGITYWVSDKLEDVTPMGEDIQTGVGDAWYVLCYHMPDTTSGFSFIATSDTQGASTPEEYVSIISGYDGVEYARVVSINGIPSVDYIYHMEDGDLYCVDYFIPDMGGVLELMAGPLIFGDDEWADTVNAMIASVSLQDY